MEILIIIMAPIFAFYWWHGHKRTKCLKGLAAKFGGQITKGIPLLVDSKLIVPHDCGSIEFSMHQGSERARTWTKLECKLKRPKKVNFEITSKLQSLGLSDGSNIPVNDTDIDRQFHVHAAGVDQVSFLFEPEVKEKLMKVNSWMLSILFDGRLFTMESNLFISNAQECSEFLDAGISIINQITAES